MVGSKSGLGVEWIYSVNDVTVFGKTRSCKINKLCLVIPFQHGSFLWLVWFMVFNATFNNISVISWRSVLLMDRGWFLRRVKANLILFLYISLQIGIVISIKFCTGSSPKLLNMEVNFVPLKMKIKILLFKIYMNGWQFVFFTS